VITYPLVLTCYDYRYPVATDRGGKPEDKENYVTLLQELHEAFAAYGYDLTVTLPCSYWYMQNFDIVSTEKYVSWFNGVSI
jgi:chitinase